MIGLDLKAAFVTLAASAFSGDCNEALTGIAMCGIEVSFDEPRMSPYGT